MISSAAFDQTSAGRACPKTAESRLRILLISNFFPPLIQGGAEIACSHLAAWLRGEGHHVGVLTLAPPGDADSQTEEAGVTIYRRRIPNVYHPFEHARAAKWKKPLWHLLDHCNPFTSGVVTDVIRTFDPDVINAHNVQGMGNNIWAALARCDVPVLVTLHDPAIACVRASMFRKGRTCEKLCPECACSMLLKRYYLGRISRLTFASPSKALLATVRPYLPAQTSNALYVENTLNYPRRKTPKARGGRLELLYVGQVTSHKGVAFILDVLEAIESTAGAFHLTVIGKGNILESLRARFAGAPWVTFTGFIPPHEVPVFMDRSDLLLVPSIWIENAPLVAVQATASGLPIIASDIGGLPELVGDHQTGRLLPAGDNKAWRDAIQQLLGNPDLLETWKRGVALRNAASDIDTVGGRYVALLRTMLTPP